MYIFYCAFVTLYLYIGTLRIMNASTWKKAADIVVKTTSVAPQASAASTAELHNLQSLQLSICHATTRPPRPSSTAECLRLIARLREEQASAASWEPRPPFEVAEMD